MTLPPETKLRIGQADVVVLGTIAGFVPDADRVALAFTQLAPTVVGLGVPDEDLAALTVLAGHERPHELFGANEDPDAKHDASHAGGTPGTEGIWGVGWGASVPAAPEGDVKPFSGLDARDARLLELLGRFGATALPSPDLAAAHKLAAGAGSRLESLDLNDAEHAEVYTRHVGFAGLLGRQRADRKAMKADLSSTPDAYALIDAWDAIRNGTRSLRRVEAAREDRMAARIRELAAGGGKLLCIVPAARFSGVVKRLGAQA